MKCSENVPEKHKAIVQFIVFADNSSAIVVSENQLFVASVSDFVNCSLEIQLAEVDGSASSSSGHLASDEFFSAVKFSSANVGQISSKGQTYSVLSLGTEYGNIDLFKIADSKK